MLRSEIINNGGDKPSLSVKGPGFNKQVPGCEFSLEEIPPPTAFAKPFLWIFGNNTQRMDLWVVFQMGLIANLQ